MLWRLRMILYEGERKRRSVRMGQEGGKMTKAN